MGLTSGTKLGRYEIRTSAGAGGMGEVYRARDARLNRDVAIKVLPVAFASDPERLRRFQQEAQAVAALNHPNILAIHDFGEHEGSPYIVTEFLEGETLRVRLGAGGLPVRKASEYADQIARGLAAAHEKGIVHRDLKPENIFVTRDGRVKILDFGLAKLVRQEGALAADAATLESQTEPGVVMGTVGYMSPEQVKGLAADHRSDLFSFGAILYEMLARKRAFHGDSSVETMSAILKHDPPELTETNRSVPPALGRIVRHCLEKTPEERFQSARDVGFALGALSDSSSSATGAVAVGTRRAWRSWARVAAELALLGFALSLFFTSHSERPSASLQAAIPPPPGDGFWANITQPAAISPDGKFLAIVAMHSGHTHLWVRRLDQSDAQPIAGSEDAANPFWSPDSRDIAFFIPGKLKKVNVSGGSVSDICPAGAFGLGGAWSPRGVILFANFGDALRMVSDGGGTPEPIPGYELPSDSLSQMWPAFLPDGKHFLFLQWKYPSFGTPDDNVWIGSIDGEKPKRLPLASTNAQYSEGYLLFSRDGDLVAQKFDLARLELSGAVLPVVRQIQYHTFLHNGAFTVSTNGILVYGTAGTGVNSQMAWLDRTGKTIGTLGEPGLLLRQSISPDGKRVAVGISPSDTREKIWIYDVERGTRIPLVSEENGPNLYRPIWSPDGKQIAYRDTVGKNSTLVVHNSDGSGEERRPGGMHFELIQPSDWSPDGQYVSVELTKFQGRANWQDVLRVAELETGKPVFDIGDASGGKFSPDGHWLAYYDESSGQVYVTSFPVRGAKIAVESVGGGDVRWRGDGQELFYLTDDQMMTAVQVRESAQEFRVLGSQPLFRLQLPNNVGFYDVTRDGKRFLVNVRTWKEQTKPLMVITNWTAELQNSGK
jgi:eukaryotic-like serine/threonine-protein kinase